MENMNELASALIEAQKQMGAAKKGATNPFFKSKFADLGNIIEAIKDPLLSNGICYVQTVESDNGNNYLRTSLIHKSGQSISGRMLIKPTKDDMQGIGSAITYARRYGLQAIVGLPAEDDDGNAASVEINYVSKEQLCHLLDIADNLPDSETKKGKFLNFMEVDSFEKIRLSDFTKAMSALGEAQGRAKKNENN